MPTYVFRITTPFPLSEDVIKKIEETVRDIIMKYSKVEVSIEVKPVPRHSSPLSELLGGEEEEYWW